MDEGIKHIWNFADYNQQTKASIKNNNLEPNIISAFFNLRNGFLAEKLIGLPKRVKHPPFTYG